MQRILVAVDGSPWSIEALQWGAELSAGLGVGTTAITAWGPGAHLAFDIPHRLPAEDASRAVEDALEKTITDAGLAGVGTVVAFGGPSQVLHRVVSEPGVVALVMGTRGLGTLPGLLLGSVSRRMLFDSPVPLFLLPQHGPAGVPQLRRMLLAVDGSPVSRTIVAWGAGLCSRLDANATVIRCVDPGAELPAGHLDTYLAETRSLVEERWCERLTKRGVTYEVLAVQGDPRREILATAEDRDADLVVVAGRGAGQFRGLGGTTSYLVRHSRVPLAVVPADESWTPTEF